MNFWQKLPQSFHALAPMDDVTDIVFRRVVEEVCPPEVMFTEFISIDGLLSAGRKRTLERLRIEPGLKQPLVIQIYGSDPEKFYLAAREIAQMSEDQRPAFAGIDINMGCPEKSVVARGCGGGLIGQNERAAEIILATKEGAARRNTAATPATNGVNNEINDSLPVSIKTRVGLNHIITEEWGEHLLRQDIAALTVHGRTVREMSRVPARWDEIARVAALRAEIAPNTVIIGNGDAQNRAHGEQLAATSGVDGIMIGRGIFHDIHCFASSDDIIDRSPHRMLEILLRHIDLYEEHEAGKPYQTLKKFYKIYVNSWPNAGELRAILMNTATPDEAKLVVNTYLSKIV